MPKLTNKELNIKIVSLRPIVDEAKKRVIRKLIAQIQRYTNGKDLKKKNRIGKYEKEIAAIRKLNKDEITKFALLNVKRLEEFKFNNETPVEQIGLYKVATENCLVKEIDELRKIHQDWHQIIPFLLQRFGQIAKSKKQELLKKKSIINENEGDEDEEKNLDGENSDDENFKEPISNNEESHVKTPKTNNISTTSASLHPSWIAKQQRAEEQRQLLQGPQKNKKIKFDD